jgi:cysteine desulfurase
VGLALALELAQAERQAEGQRLQDLQQLFFDLLEQKIPGSIINGSRKKRLPGNVHVTIPGQDNERLLMALDEAGIMAAAGSACLASSDEPSHVLTAMGVSDADARAALRFTMGRATTEADIRQTVEALAKLISRA